MKIKCVCVCGANKMASRPFFALIENNDLDTDIELPIACAYTKTCASLVRRKKRARDFSKNTDTVNVRCPMSEILRSSLINDREENVVKSVRHNE